jgi:hypothetical protein
MKSGYLKKVAWEREWMMRLKELAMVVRKINNDAARRCLGEAVEMLDAYVIWHVLPEVMNRPAPDDKALRRLHQKYRSTLDYMVDALDVVEEAVEKTTKKNNKEKTNGNDRRDVPRAGVAVRDRTPNRRRKAEKAPL